MGTKQRLMGALVAALLGASLSFITGAAPAGAAPAPSCASERVSGAPGNVEPDDRAAATAMSPDARYVVFTSESTNLVSGDGNGNFDVFLRDRNSAATELISKAPSGAAANGKSLGGGVSDDGRYVIFTSDASNLVANDSNGRPDVFVRDRTLGQTVRVSVKNDGSQAAGDTPESFIGLSRPVRLSADGHTAVFTSSDATLVPGDSNSTIDLFARDLAAGTTTRLDVSSAGAEAASGLSTDYGLPGVSADGRYVAFVTRSKLAVDDVNTFDDGYVRDRQAGTTTLVTPGEGISSSSVALDASGAQVAFVTSDNLLPEDTESGWEAYVRNWKTGALRLATHDPNSSVMPGERITMSPDARFVGYVKDGSSRVPAVGDASGATPDRVVEPLISGGFAPEPYVSADGTRAAFTGTRPDNYNFQAFVAGVGAPTLYAQSDFSPHPVEPTSVRQGDSQPVVVNGFNLDDIATLDLGTGVAVSNVDVTSSRQVQATATVAPTAPLGSRTVSVTNGSSCPASLTANGFTVTPGADVASVSPRYFRPGAVDAPVTVNGAGFRSGGAVSVGGTGVTVTQTAVVSEIKATAKVSVASGTAGGARSVTFTQANGASGTCPDCLIVDAQAPTVLGLVPSGGDKYLTTIVVFLQDDNAVDEAATQITLTRDGVTAPFTRDNANENMVVLHPTNPQDGRYTVGVRPHDDAGNVGPLTNLAVDQGTIITNFNAYGAFTGGASVATGDVDGDGTDEIVTAAGPGGGPHVAIWKVGKDGVTRPYAGFMAYAPQYAGGIDVATGDVDDDGRDEVITAALAGGPHVQTWDIAGGTGTVQSSWYSYAPSFSGGVRVAAADVDGDGSAEVVTGPASNGGPHVRVWRPSGGTAHEQAGWMAYAPNFIGGLTLGASDLDGDGLDEVITGAGVGGGPHVQVFVVEGGTGFAVGGWMAYDPNFRGGVQVAGGDLDGDGLGEVITAAGPGGGPHVRAWIFDGEEGFEVDGFMAYASNLPSGVSVASGDPDGDGDDDIVTVPYRNAVANVTARRVV